jgi:CRISPR-associated protein Cas5t
MKTAWLRVRAPFAAYRWMQAGVWRSTSPVMPHSAAWGLALNLAGVETRGSKDGVTTLIREDAPKLRIAVGEPDANGVRSQATRGSLYQQLHTYPVGNSGEELAERTFGAKYWIVPARREFLIDLDCILGIQADDELVAAILGGLRGETAAPRYGLPFAGDNNLLIDSIDVLPAPPRTWWYVPLGEDDPAAEGSCRLTVSIDRSDSSKTLTRLFAPQAGDDLPQDKAWQWVPGAPA